MDRAPADCAPQHIHVIARTTASLLSKRARTGNWNGLGNGTNVHPFIDCDLALFSCQEVNSHGIRDRRY
jgi:hypothetical protein